ERTQTVSTVFRHACSLPFVGRLTLKEKQPIRASLPRRLQFLKQPCPGTVKLLATPQRTANILRFGVPSKPINFATTTMRTKKQLLNLGFLCGGMFLGGVL